MDKQNEIEVLTTNLRELQSLLVDNGGGILYPTSRTGKDGRPRKRSVKVRVDTPQNGSDESFRIRVQTPSEDGVRALPDKTSSPDRYLIHSGSSNPSRRGHLGDGPDHDEDWTNYEECGEYEEYDEEYYYDGDGGYDEDDYWDGHQPDFEPPNDDPATPPPPPTPSDNPQTPQRVSRWRSSPQSSEKCHLRHLEVCTKLAAASSARTGNVAHQMLLSMRRKWMTA